MEERQAMAMTRPYPWESAYPEGVRWDAPILRATLPDVLARAAAAYGDAPAIEFRDRTIGFDTLAPRAAARPSCSSRLRWAMAWS